MTPEIVSVNGKDYRIFDDGNGVKYAASAIDTFGMRRAFGLQTGQGRIIDFLDIKGSWAIDSVYISSPDTSELTVEILDGFNNSFFKDKLLRDQLPKSLPTVIIDSKLKMKLTASRDDIDAVLIYLRPVYMAFYKDF